jgi:2-succinyl-6-hydroxy-2,4-cyclohexadiene-1-carboxylate synthase
VLGYSLGARVTLGLLVHHPGLLAAAALIGVNPGLDDVEERAARIAADDRWRSILDRGDLAGFIDAWSSQELFATQKELPSEVLGRQRAERLSHSAAGLSRSLRIMGLAAMPSYRSALRRIERPVDLVVGGNDEKFMAIAGGVLADLPAGHLHVVQGAGHNLLIESPDEVARIIRKGIET